MSRHGMCFAIGFNVFLSAFALLVLRSTTPTVPLLHNLLTLPLTQWKPTVDFARFVDLSQHISSSVITHPSPHGCLHHHESAYMSPWQAHITLFNCLVVWHCFSLVAFLPFCAHWLFTTPGITVQVKHIVHSTTMATAALFAAKSTPSLSIGGKSYGTNDLNAWEVQQYLKNPQPPMQTLLMHPVLITFVRHGETAENASGTIQGWTPTDLNECGLRQAEACAAWMKQHYLDICAIVTSDLPRARSTADVIHKAFNCNLPFRVTKNLRERKLGIFETKFSKEAQAFDPELAKEFTGPIFYDMIAAKHPETKVESRDEFLARGKEALREVFELAAQLAAENAERRDRGEKAPSVPHVVVVSHGQIIRIMTSLLLANPHLLPTGPEFMDSFYAPNQSIGHLFSWRGDKLSNTALTRIVLQVEQPRASNAPLFFTPPTLLARNVTTHLGSTSVLQVFDERGGE